MTRSFKRFILAASLFSLALFATACTAEAKAKEPEENAVEVVETQKTNAELNAEEAEAEKNAEAMEAEENDAAEEDADEKDAADDSELQAHDVALIYPSTDYIVEGKEDEKTVRIDTTVDAAKGELVVSVLDALAEEPTLENAEPVGLDAYDYSRSTLKDGEAVVDLSGSLQGGSLEEDVLVSSIVNTLLSVDGIKSVSFTVNGESAETLMGHVDISNPFTAPLS